MIYQLSPVSIEFPSPRHALEEPNGLLAVGGDLSVSRLINAYQQGIFPWFSHDDPILWWSPDPRAVFWPDELHVSRSLKKFLRKSRYTITLNKDFTGVISACQSVHSKLTGTWITDSMKAAYITLHEAGHAHSVEVWESSQLVGGLYGVCVGHIFCGESMFHKADHASKAALLGLSAHLSPLGLKFIDCQMPNPHLISLGAKPISRDDYLSVLNENLKQNFPAHTWVSTEIRIHELAF